MAESYLQSFCDEEDEQKVEAPRSLQIRPREEKVRKLQALCIPSSLMVSLSPPLIIRCASKREIEEKNSSMPYASHGKDERERESIWFFCIFFLKD